MWLLAADTEEKQLIRPKEEVWRVARDLKENRKQEKTTTSGTQIVFFYFFNNYLNATIWKTWLLMDTTCWVSFDF